MLILTDGRAEMPRLLTAFRNSNAGLPAELCELVVQKIEAYANQR